MVKNENLLIPAAGRPQMIAFSMNEDVENASWYPPKTFMVTPHFADGTPTCN